MSIGTNIKRRRYELKMSQQELADAMGYSTRSTIAKIESDENSVSSKKLVNFARILDTTIEDLVKGAISPNLPNYEISPINGHKNIVVILAGGKSTRNQQNIPNQFINVFGKPVIIYTMEAYQKHAAINEMYVVCLKGWEDILKSYAVQFGITKLKKTIPAGDTGILSVKTAVEYLSDKCNENDTIIFQESTRPLVNENNISKLLLNYSQYGSAVTGCSMSDHLQFLKNEDKLKYINRNFLIEVQSPEAYRHKDLDDMLKKAVKLKHRFTESCCSMFMYDLGMKPNFFEGNLSNIKILRQEDIAVFNAYVKSKAEY